jgi:threonine dehydrogenase-like Zn-dependent dehydrogenase
MKAVLYRRSAGLVFEEVPKPEFGANEVLIRVANTGFCGSDHSLVESGLVPDGYILGHETSGVIEAFGKEVKNLNVGSRVMIRPTFCGKCRHCLAQNPHLCIQNRRTIGVGDLPGGFAEYVKIFPQMVIPIPDGVDSQSAALTETFASALPGKPRGVADHREAAGEHGEDGDQGIQITGGGQGNRQSIIGEGKEKILADDFESQRGKVPGIQEAGRIGG